MPIVTTTTKGQVVIPAALRKKLNIKKGTALSILEKDGKLIMEPLSGDPIEAGRGMLSTHGRVLKRLLEDRRFEST